MRTYQIILLGILLGVFFGFFDALVDTAFFSDKTFIQNVLRPDAGEIWSRSFVIFLFIIFGVVVSRIITHLKRTKELLKVNEEKYRKLITKIDTGFALHEIVLDDSGKPVDYIFLEINKGFEKQTGLSEEDLIGKKVTVALPKTEQFWIDTYGKVALTGEATSFEHYTEQIQKWYAVHAYRPMKNQFAVIFNDITDRKEAETEIHKSEEKYREFIENTDDLVTQVDNTGKFLMVNHKAKEIFGLEPGECIGKSAFSFVHPDDTDETQRWFNEQIEKNATSGNIANRQVDIFGNIHHMLWATNIHYDENGNAIHLNSIASDITQLKNNEEALHKSLDEKDFLINEVNHRVKNNLAILQNLVSMQSSYVNDTAVKGYLNDIENRIRSMSLIHKRLYTTTDVTQVEMKDYVTSLATGIFTSLVKGESEVKLELDIDETMLHVNYATPCGLIINELLTNAIKHAFPVNAKGTVSIVFHKEQDGHYRLTIRDSGIGLPDGFDLAKPRGLGMKVVRSLFWQLKGILEYKSDKGAVFSFRFKTEEPIRVP